MKNTKLKGMIGDRFKEVINNLLYESAQNECLEDYLLDLKYYGSVKTFKEICKCNGQDYKKEILNLKQELKGK